MQCQKIEQILNSKWTKKNINSICTEVTNILKVKEVTEEILKKYAYKSSILYLYWERVSWLNKVRLLLILKDENIYFSKHYHEENITLKAIALLLSAEVLSLDFNPKEDLNGRVASFFISLASLVVA